MMIAFAVLCVAAAENRAAKQGLLANSRPAPRRPAISATMAHSAPPSDRRAEDFQRSVGKQQVKRAGHSPRRDAEHSASHHKTCGHRVQGERLGNPSRLARTKRNRRQQINNSVNATPSGSDHNWSGRPMIKMSNKLATHST